MREADDAFSLISSANDADRLDTKPDEKLVELGEFAERLLRARTNISRHLPGHLFADPAYDILLGLFGSAQRGVSVSVSDCGYMARLPSATNVRWLAQLAKVGLIERVPDERDNRRTWVELTPRATAAMTTYLTSISAIPLARDR